MITLLIAALAFAACAALRRCAPDAEGRRCGPVRVKLLWNRGAAFGLPIPGTALVPASLAALGAFFLLRRRSVPGAGLVIGGGASNLWERARSGRVLDYLSFPMAPGRLGRYVFNLADLVIFLGGLLMLIGGKES